MRERRTGYLRPRDFATSSLSVRGANVDADRLIETNVSHVTFDLEPRTHRWFLARTFARGNEQQGKDCAFHGAPAPLSVRQVPNRQARLSQSVSNAHDGVAL